ncbi:cyclase family protein [Petroclostridium sp. X23]|uniref:cyclase family protein n=1 Tax=Petroclostridium sp. X23 TaxID=3045146 RepID=UPI0024AC920F|nr:cyclase family protein [Petroclostridium sp. X23]WHH60367.1 cyclase family protein [Petroclostridium sp. X23]
MYKCLSYQINGDDPKWPGNPELSFQRYESIAEGDIANTYKMSLFNHNGSHMDAPKHFNDSGLKISELPLEKFIYEKPLLIDVPKSFGQLITIEDLKPYESEIKQSDVLMIRTGFSANRGSEPERYTSEGPGVSSETAKYMIENFSNLKAIAIDWISLASYAHMQDGCLAHEYLLGKFTENYICIIEDVNFDGIEADQIKRVFSIPLFIKELDSSPVTVIAEIE